MENVVLVIVIVVLIYLIIGNILYFFVICGGKNALFKIIDKNIEKMLIPYKNIYNEGANFFKKSKHKELHIKSFDGVDLYGQFIENEKSKYILILAHGYRSTKERDVYAALGHYYEWGFSILAIDERGCGKSGGKHITFGNKESKDIDCWINYIYKKYNKDIILGGVSLGASSVLMVNNEHVKMIIEDSGYANAYKEVKYTINHYSHLPLSIFMPIINLYSTVLAETNLKSIKVKENLKKLNIPILFIHGSSDDFVPPENVFDLYRSYEGPKKLLIIKNAEHGMGYLVNKNLYLKKLKQFIDENMI